MEYEADSSSSTRWRRGKKSPCNASCSLRRGMSVLKELDVLVAKVIGFSLCFSFSLQQDQRKQKKKK